jgi:hypothetical protein
MAVAFDAVGPSSAGQSGTLTASITWSHTCAGANRYAVVCASFGTSGSDAGITLSATFGGTSMASLGVVHSNNGTSGFVQLFGLVNPATGANTVVVTASSGTNDIVGGSISFTGVHQTTPVGTAVTNFGAATPATVAVTGTTAGNMVVDAVCNGNNITSSNQTQRWLKNAFTTTAAGCAAGSTAAAGGTVTMSYAVTADWYGIVGVEVKAASAGLPPGYPQVVNRAALIRANYW